MIEEVEPRKLTWKQFAVGLSVIYAALKLFGEMGQAWQTLGMLSTPEIQTEHRVVTETQTVTETITHNLDPETPPVAKAKANYYAIYPGGGASVALMEPPYGMSTIAREQGAYLLYAIDTDWGPNSVATTYYEPHSGRMGYKIAGKRKPKEDKDGRKQTDEP